MVSDARFRYALQPMLLTRQWELDRLRSELGELNLEWTAQNATVQMLLGRHKASMEAWAGMQGTAQILSIDKFVMQARYIDDCGRQASVEREVLAALEQRREELVGRLHLAQRALDGVQEHREKMQAQYLQARASLDFKAADDQWGMSRTMGAVYDNES